MPDAASIPADSSDHAVSADATDLAPATVYHFRLVAANVEGDVNGLDRTLTTTAGPPLIGSQSAEAVGFSDATVSAKINPQGAMTTYHVEYGTSAAYGQSTTESAPIVGFATDNSFHTVSVHIGGLQAGTAYHFRFVATSSTGIDEGADATFATYPAPPAFAPCPNDLLRSGPGARLPDCRAYEQATPIDKHGADAQGRVNQIQASSAGDRVTFFTNGGLPTTGGSAGLYPFLASRGSGGWSSDGLQPATDPDFSSSIMGWSDDLSTTAVTVSSPSGVGDNLYLRDSDTGAFRLGLESPSEIGGSSAALGGFAADTSHLIFESGASLLPGVPATGTKLYDLDHGVLTLVGRIPSGSATSCDDEGGPACVIPPGGSFAGPYDWYFQINTRGGASNGFYTQNTISRDGSKAFFTAGSTPQLYVRKDGTATTQVSASQRTTPDPNGHKPAAFMAATPDGSEVFFASCEKLTDDSTAVSTGANNCSTESQGRDLYSYETGTGALTDITVDPNASDSKRAAVQGVLGISDDGSYVYFAANGVLAPGASSGNCTFGSLGGGTCNLYVSHDGVTTFIARVDGSSGTEGADWTPLLLSTGANGQKISRVTPDGRTLLFSSLRSLTDYDNHIPASGGCGAFKSLSPPGVPCAELFRYSAPSGQLACVSCNPTGLPPSGEAVLGTNGNGRFFARIKTTFLTRNLSADGNRVFFDSPDALLPTDTNGVKDVYEWEAQGSGSCQTVGGCIYLISSGASPSTSYLADASANGDHVFFFTNQQLVPTDRDQLYDVYDAGAGAGLPSQHPLAPPTCTSIACQANPAPPPEQTPASAAFSGPGNAREGSAARKCPQGKRKVRHAGKVRCQKAHKQHKRHTNRGGSK